MAAYSIIGSAPAYMATAPSSGLAGLSAFGVGSNQIVKHKDGYYANSSGVGSNYAALASAADSERAANLQRAADRQNAVIGGYDQQILNSRAMGQQGYDNLDANYAAITGDALTTRDRNMKRVDEYGNSMRSDLAIKNQQALAAASQSAIKRGLGNTTIQDSLVRGQNFDNTRQLMSLEDQLLQNRISTDASLSANYQNALTDRAKNLASQWNANTANENQLATGRLGYIGNIQDDKGYIDIANIYSQGLQQENANQQAGYDRSLDAMKIPAKFRYVNGQVQKSVDSGRSWQPDTDQRQNAGTGWSGWL